MIDGLNKEAFEFIKLISVRPKQTPNQGEGLKGSAKERGVNDFSDRIDGKGVARIMTDAEKIVGIFLITDDESYGFEEKEYPLYESFIARISLLDEFQNTVSKSFIEHKSFDWIINIYQNKKATSNLIDHLLLETPKVVKDHEFYFPILNLDIESPFKLGNVEFIFFKEEYLDELYKHYQTIPKPIGENDFNEIFRKDYQGKPLVKVIIKAESQKAEEIAINDAETAVDVLKIFSSTLLIPEQRMMFDLNHRLNYPEKSKFLSKDPTEKYGYAINVRWNNPLFELTNKHLDFAFKAGMHAFSNFITLKKGDDFYNLLIQAIHFTASALSNWDLHSRCVNIITILESLLLKDDETNELEHKAKARLSKIISNVHKEKEEIKELFRKIYQVRHKMIHKGKRIDVNSEDLRKAQIILITLLLRLIDFSTNNRLTDKVTLIEKLNKEKS